MAKGSTLTVKNVDEGFRYYVGFSNALQLEKVIDSYSTHVECNFGGLNGRPLQRGDEIAFRDNRTSEPVVISDQYIP